MLTPTGSSFSAPVTTRDDYARACTNLQLSTLEQRLARTRALWAEGEISTADVVRGFTQSVKVAAFHLGQIEAFSAQAGGQR